MVQLALAAGGACHAWAGSAEIYVIKGSPLPSCVRAGSYRRYKKPNSTNTHRADRNAGITNCGKIQKWEELRRGSPPWGDMKADNWSKGGRLKIADSRANFCYHSQLQITAGGWGVKPPNPFQSLRPGSLLGAKKMRILWFAASN